MNKKTLKFLIIILTSVNLVTGAIVYNSLADTAPEQVVDFDLLTSAVSAIRENYVDQDIKTTDLIEGAMEGMLSHLDPYSQYMNLKAREEMEVETSGKFGGLGIEIIKKDGFVTIITPIDNTPAARIGLQAGDKIVGINGTPLKDPDLTDVVDQLRGEPGTSVTITILRAPDTVKDYSITRAVIKVSSIIDPAIIEDGIGYIRISQFQENTARDLEKAIKDLVMQGMDSLVLDVRRNPGGLLVSAVEVVDMFIPPKQVVVSTKGKGRFQNRDYRSETQTPYLDIPLVVLIDQGSASASEIVAGALHDLNRAVLIGAKSFGKGSVQTILPLGTDAALRLTTAKYFTPSGVCIHEKGIEPDIEVELTAKDREHLFRKKYYDMEKALGKLTDEEQAEINKLDPQLQRGVDIIKALKVYRKTNLSMVKTNR